MLARLLLAAALVLATSTALSAQTTFTVTTTDDAGPGSLRQAILDANANPGADTILFDAAVFPEGSATPITLATDLPAIDGTEGAVVDGTGAGVLLVSSGVTNGLRFGPFSATLSGLVVRNLAIEGGRTGVSVSAEVVADVVIEGVTVTGVSGPTASGIDIFGNETVTNVLIDDCTLSAEGGDGVSVYSIEGTSRIRIRESTSTASGDGFNVGSNGLVSDVAFERTTASASETGYSLFGGGGFANIAATDVEATGNEDGWVLSGAELSGLVLRDSRFSDNEEAGLRISVQGALSGSRIEGNTVARNGRDGLSVFIAGAAEMAIIGNEFADNGTTPSDDGIDFGGGVGATPSEIVGNTVSGSAGMGILVYLGRVTISQNVTQDNALLGIDLRPSNEPPPYVTANDPGDEDDGVNRLQNVPELTAASGDGAALTVSYAVPSLPAFSTYPLTIEFFLADADGEEGQVFLGTDTYAESDAQAEREVAFNPAQVVPTGARLLATATDADGNTSEFSASVAVSGSVASEGDTAVPTALTLDLAGPNPFRRATMLTLTMPEAGPVQVAVYDVLGRQVAVLHDGTLAAGMHRLRVDGEAFSAGVYVVRADAEATYTTRSVTFAR